MFRKLPRIDAVFVPGGDPGHTEPKVLMALLEKETQVLHRYHPKAQMWVSPQGFNQEWLDEFSGNSEPRAARLADRRCIRSAGAHHPRRAAREGAAALSHPALSGHHAQPAIAISGAGLGRRVRGHRRPRSDQSAPGGRGGNLPSHTARHHRVPHVFGRLQRRCQQVHLERARLGSGRERARTFCASTAGISSAISTKIRFAQGLLALERNWRGPLRPTAAYPRRWRNFRAWSALHRRETR